MSYAINALGTELLLNLEQVFSVKKKDHNQLLFCSTGGVEAVAVYPSTAERDAAFDDLQDTGPSGPPGQGPGRGLGQP